MRFAFFAAVAALSGCGLLPDAYTGCEEAQVYQSAQDAGPLRVPAGADRPDTRNALKIPEMKTPELPRAPGTCLEHPPSMATSAAATTGSDSAAAATTGSDSAAAAGAAETAAVDRTPELQMDDGSPWHTRLGLNYQLSSSTDFDGGTTAEFKSSTGFLVGLGYDLSDHLEIGANFTYDERDYDARLAGDVPGEVFPVKGSLESMGVMVNLNYYFMTGRFTPYITTGIGWNFVDTNIPTAPPQVGCWWNPWYGYICEGFQETKNVDGFAYQLGAGMRYRLNQSLSLTGGYQMSWLDFPKADGTPSYDGLQLILNWDF